MYEDWLNERPKVPLFGPYDGSQAWKDRFRDRQIKEDRWIISRGYAICGRWIQYNSLEKP